MKISGKIKTIFDQTLFAKRFTKREFILQTFEQKPQFLIMEFISNEFEILDGFFEGDEVLVDFKLVGIEWTNPKGGKVYFKFLRVNKIRKLDVNYQNFEKLNLSHFLVDINNNQN